MTKPTTSLAQIAIDTPAAPGVFLRHGLDFCCHGQRSLAEACGEKGLDPQAIIGELESAAAPQGVAARLKDRPLPEIIDVILGPYHAPLRRDLPGLIDLAAKVERVHAEKPSCPHGIAEHLREVLASVESHMAKEEKILFPLIRTGYGAGALMPIKVMMAEHEDHGESLRRTRELTGDLVPPPEACTSWRALYVELARLEAELMEHIHLENNVLFPRALNGDGAFGRRE